MTSYKENASNTKGKSDCWERNRTMDNNNHNILINFYHVLPT